MEERYLNPFVDYGFKKLFATEENKDLLISFLNALFSTEDPIVDITYKNVEQIGEINGTRTNYFDVYCTTSSEKEFIVEMQNSWQPFFKDRMLYYASKLIRNQGKKGIQQMLDSSMNEKEDDNEKKCDEKKESDEKKGKKKQSKKRNKGWDFEMKDVYVVALMNFKLPNKEYPDHSFLHKVQLMDVDDLRVFYEKLTLVYVELPKLDDVELDLNTPLGRWLYALNNLYYYDQKPEELKEPVFDKLFRQAELALLTPDQDLAYERSMKVYLDTYNQLKGARILGQREGMAKGEKLGLEKGKKLGLEKGEKLGLEKGEKLGLEKGKKLGLAEAKRETAKRMLNLGFDLETICQVTGLTQEEIER